MVIAGGAGLLPWIFGGLVLVAAILSWKALSRRHTA